MQHRPPAISSWAFFFAVGWLALVYALLAGDGAELLVGAPPGAPQWYLRELQNVLVGERRAS